MKLLCDLRPAREGFAGVPQETRLMFAALAQLEGVELEGLLQADLDFLSEAGLQRWLEPGAATPWRGRVRTALAAAGALPVLASAMLSRRQRVETAGLRVHEDAWWEALFARSVPAQHRPLLAALRYRRLRRPRMAFQLASVASARLLGLPLLPEVDTAGAEVLVAHTPWPGRAPAGTRLVVRYYDAIPLLLPHTVKDGALHAALHRAALRRNVADGAWFACISDESRDDLVRLIPQAAARAVTVPVMVSHHYAQETRPADGLAQLWARHRVGGTGPDGACPPYLLMVSTLEPRKNHRLLWHAFERLRAGGWPDLRLVLVGGAGWGSEALMRELAPGIASGAVQLLRGVPAEDLRWLYRHAAVTVAPSIKEGFDYSGVEAMCCGGVVAASDIRVHRDVYADAAEYFDPVDPDRLAQCLAGLLAPGAEPRRQQLRRAGATVSERYRPAQVLPQWRALLERVTA